MLADKFRRDISFNNKILSRTGKVSLELPKEQEDYKVKPFVKWAGGKRSLIKELISRLPKAFHNYYEPFIGRGHYFLRLLFKTQLFPILILIL